MLTGCNVTGHDAYLFVGVDRGFFREAGLDVEVKPGAGTGNDLKLLHAGHATLAVLDMTGALIEYSRSGITDVRVLTAAPAQRQLHHVLTSRGISRPQDEEGKSIGYTPGGVNYTLFPTYAKLAGFDAGKVQCSSLARSQG